MTSYHVGGKVQYPHIRLHSMNSHIHLLFITPDVIIYCFRPWRVLYTRQSRIRIFCQWGRSFSRCRSALILPTGDLHLIKKQDILSYKLIYLKSGLMMEVSNKIVNQIYVYKEGASVNLEPSLRRVYRIKFI